MKYQNYNQGVIQGIFISIIEYNIRKMLNKDNKVVS